MGKNKKNRCWVCGVRATRTAFGEHICDNPVCEQVTLEDITLGLAMEKVQEKEREFRNGECV